MKSKTNKNSCSSPCLSVDVYKQSLLKFEDIKTTNKQTLSTAHQNPLKENYANLICIFIKRLCTTTKRETETERGIIIYLLERGMKSSSGSGSGNFSMPNARNALALVIIGIHLVIKLIFRSNANATPSATFNAMATLK